MSGSFVRLELVCRWPWQRARVLRLASHLATAPDEVLQEVAAQMSPSGSRPPPPSRCSSEMIRFQQEYLRHESGNYAHPTGLKAVNSHCLTVVKRQSRPPRPWKQERVVTRCKCWRGNPCWQWQHVSPRGGALFGFCFNPLSPLGAGPWTTHTAVPKISWRRRSNMAG